MDVTTSRNGLRALRAFFVLLVVLLYAPILILFVFSVNDGTLIAFPLEGFTLDWYRAFLANDELVGALRTSALVAAVSSAAAVAISVPAAIAMARRRFFGKAVVSVLILSPLVMPFVVLGISLLILFNTIGMPLSIVTIAIGHVVISIPYAILILVPRLERISALLEEAARDLGATGLLAFRWITFPLIFPALVSAYLVAFTLSFDEVVIASFVVGDQTTYPIYVFSQLRLVRALPPVIALAVVVMLFSIVIVIIAEIVRRVSERRLATSVSEAMP